MRFFLVCFGVLFSALALGSRDCSASPEEAAKCKAQAKGPCLKFRGAFYNYWNGGCPAKIHVVGTRHLICVRNSLPDGFPTASPGPGKHSDDYVYAGDYEVCPVQTEKAGEQGYGCVLGVKNVSVQIFRGR